MPEAWTRPTTAPPPQFFGSKERDYVKQVNDELIECIIGQPLLYYPISIEHTHYNLYGEAIKKTFLPPVHIYALIVWEGYETQTTEFGIDKRPSIIVHFHHRRLTDQDLWVRNGDFICYAGEYYEIVTLNEPQRIFGQAEHQMEIEAKCVKAREGLFNAK